MNCLSESQLYVRVYLFCISMQNKISVSGNLSDITRVWENIKLAMQRYKVVLPSEEINDPLAVLRHTVAGSVFFYSCPQSCYIHLHQ